MLRWTLLLALLVPASARADAGEEMPECKEDVGLARAAAELLLAREAPSAEALTGAVRAAGSDLVSVHAFFERAERAGTPPDLAALAHAADAPLVCGFAESDRARLTLVAARAGSLEPVTAHGLRVRGTLAPGFRDPELVIADARGDLQRVRLDGPRLAHGVELPEELARPAKVQLLARGPSGPRPIAERLVPSDGDAGRPSLAPAPSAPEASPETDDASPSALLAALRSQHARAALRENQLLARVAAQHAKAVCRDGKVAHELTPGEDPERRLREAGVQAHRVGETVARAASTRAAFAAFEHSPSHLLTLLEPGFTDAGIGKAQDERGRTCVVALLAAWPRFVGR